MAVQCPQCQGENPPQARFCLECGARLALTCAHCGTELPAHARFCLQCGQPARAGTALAPAPAPQSYTPRHLAERILTSRAALEGERKQVTVLFADLKGSMELLADRDPEEARAILDPVLERMMEAVHRYEGTVNQVMGDGIMALFGAPLAHEDHAVRACYAALRMQETVKQHAEEVRRTTGLPVQIRVGLNSGEVVVRSIGSDLHMDYTAVGQTTHLAARMEQMAAPGSILLPPATLQLAEGYVQVHSLGPLPVKGLSEPIEVFEITGAAPTRGRLQAAAVRGLTRFVGRDAELDTLRQSLERAGTSRGQVVALVGEPGVGKSRLVWEFSHSHRTQGWLVLESRSVSYGKTTAYLPVIDLLKTYCGIDAADDPRRMREKLTGKVLTLDPALGPTLPPLLSLLDLPVDDPAWQALDPPQRRQRTLDAVKRLLLRESQVQPLLLVCEDLHWIDSETQALLDSLVESLPTARILLLVNYRPEYEHTWHRKTYYQQLRLDPLPPASADTLLAALLGDAPALTDLKGLLIARTEGNPFFLEESVRGLVETGALAGERGGYRPAKPVGTMHVPATVQAVLAARIDRLPPDEKRLLQSAAVIGKDVPHALLRAITEEPEARLRQGLSHLQAAEFLYETSLFPEPEFTFRHALTHEVAYGSLLQERRCLLHRRVAEAIEGLYSDRLAEHVERLAYHALRGEVWDKAVAYLYQAGVKASTRSAHGEAVTYYGQALEVLSRLPESPERVRQAIDLRLDLRNSLLPLGEHAQLLDQLREAETLAEAAGDQRRLGRVSTYKAERLLHLGQHEQAIAAAERALAVAESTGDVAIQIEARVRLGQPYFILGQYPSAIECFRRNVIALQGELVYEPFGFTGPPAAFCRAWLGICLAEIGDFDAAVAAAEEAVRIAGTTEYAFTQIAVARGLGEVYLRRGQLSEAIPVLERGLAICQSQHIPFLFPLIASSLGHAYALSGRLDEGLPLLEQALRQAPSMRSMWGQSLWVADLSEAYLLAGRREEATDLAEQLLVFSQQHTQRGDEAWILRLLGEIAAQADPLEVDEAESHYRAALALAEELGMRPLVAHCHRGLGTLYQKIGRGEQAQAELVTAAEMYRTMEMTFWLTRAEAELANINA